jgi:hypothetical protein
MSARSTTGHDSHCWIRARPAVAAPIRRGPLRDLAKVDCGNRRACRDCPIRARCTNDVRSVPRLENEASARPHRRAPQSKTRILDHVAKSPSIRLAVSMSGFIKRLSNAQPHRRTPQIQSHRACLQFALFPQHPRRRSNDHCRHGLRVWLTRACEGARTSSHVASDSQWRGSGQVPSARSLRHSIPQVSEFTQVCEISACFANRNDRPDVPASIEAVASLLAAIRA